jgi:4-carboxymuconolactone decarboxylase
VIGARRFDPFARGLAGTGVALAAATTVAAVIVAGGALAQSLPIEDIQLRGDRFHGLHYRDMTEEQRALLYNVVNSARAVTNTTGNGPFNALLRSPKVGDLSQQLGNAIRFSSGLSGRLREIATLMAGRAWTSTYEWYAHARYALDEGIDAAAIQAIAEHRTPNLAAMPAADAMVWRVSDELLTTRRISDATFAEALAVLDERRLLSSVVIAAYYEYVSMLLNVDRYPLPADAPPEAAKAARAIRALPTDALHREPRGASTARPAISDEDTERALAVLGASVDRDDELPREARDAARRAIMREWQRAPQDGAAGVAQRFAAELLDTRAESDATNAAALEALGERGVVNLIVLMGYSNIRCAQQALAGVDCVL